MIPSSSCSKNHVKAEDGPTPQFKFSSRKRVSTLHSQSTCSTIFLASAQFLISLFTFLRGPSAAMYSLGGFAFRMASKTSRVVSGLLKITNNTGVRSGLVGVKELITVTKA